MRQTLPAVVHISGQGRPAGGHILLVGVPKSGRSGDVAVGVELAAFAVTDCIQWLEDVGAELAALFQYRINGLGIDVFVLGQFRQFGFDIEHFMKHELHVAQRRCVLRH